MIRPATQRTHTAPLMPTEAPPCLIVAISGRALAASAIRAGHAVVVLDCFADADTARLSRECRSVASRHGIRFDRPRLLRASWEVAPLPGAGLVYGSGFEGRVDLLEAVALERTRYGNTPATVAAVRDPQQFFTRLDQLGLPHPQVCFERPAPSAGWLRKEAGSAGGTGVQPAGAGAARKHSYYQQQADGVPMSVLFLADGQRARIVGFNAQWHAPQPERPFLYGGAVSRVPIPETVEREVRSAVDALVGALGLRGLNGVDFLLDGDRWNLLELNPRPTATMELYDADYATGLFDWHLRASGGELPPTEAAGPSRAAAVVHATQPWTVPPDHRFPAWCSDLPYPGTRVGRGDPICTVHGDGASPEEARSLVQVRTAEMQGCIMGFTRRRAV